nr:MAG TPA: hypothetical protein [Bacteriophage sp.]
MVDVYSSPPGQAASGPCLWQENVIDGQATVASDLSQTSLTFLKELEFLWRLRIRTLKG